VTCANSHFVALQPDPLIQDLGAELPSLFRVIRRTPRRGGSRSPAAGARATRVMPRDLRSGSSGRDFHASFNCESNTNSAEGPASASAKLH